MLTTVLLFVFFALSFIPVVLYSKGVIKNPKVALYSNVGTVSGVIASFFGFSAYAAAAEEAVSGISVGSGLGMLAAGLVTGVSCIAAGLAVSKAASAAIGALSENPKTFGKALIFVALGEGIGIYGVLISIQILNKL